MLLGRAPVRISFGGGGTDLAAYYSRFGGVTISSSIDKFIYCIMTQASSRSVQVISADYQSVMTPGNGHQKEELRLISTMIGEFESLPPVNVFLASEVPPGTGLGSSGAVAVNLANTLSVLAERHLTRAGAAELAYHVEVDKLGAPVGKQDQYASAFGGMNTIYFEDGGVRVEPLSMPAGMAEQLESRLLLFFTGNSRHAWNILREQRDLTSQSKPIVVESLHRIKELALDIKQALEAGDLDAFSGLLDEGWKMKKRLATGVTNEQIDEAYSAACKVGARGGKLTGAGGGGFMLLYCEEDAQPRVRCALEALGLTELSFKFDVEGARILMNMGVTSNGVKQYVGS